MALVDLTKRQEPQGYTCDNCGRQIGALEQPYQWGNGVVCPECCAILQAASAAHAQSETVAQKRKKKSQAPLVAAIIAFGVIGAVVIIAVVVSHHNSADRSASNQSLPDKQNQAALAPGKGTVSGSAWMQRQSGASDVQRGMTVMLVSPITTREQLVPELASEIEDWKKEADSARGWVQKWNEKATEAAKDFPDDPHITDEPRKNALDSSREAAAAELKMATIRDKMAALPAKMPLLDAYRLLIQFAPSGIASGGKLISDSAALTHTDGEGKYTFDGVAPGEYVLFAFVSSDYWVVDWCLPIRVADGEKVKVDLFNQNAELVKNIRGD